jgi:hypothetical protein
MTTRKYIQLNEFHFLLHKYVYFANL